MAARVVGVTPRGLAFFSGNAVAGERLSDSLAKTPLPLSVALRYAVELGGLLHQAHSAGRVHGALTPSCILAADSLVLLAPGEEAGVTPYTSPEQLEGLAPDARSDVFAFGGILYEMITGFAPFRGDSEEELTEALREHEPEPVAAILAAQIQPATASLYASLDGVISGCLAKHPDQRRQRIQNAVIELKLIARPLSRAAAPARRAAPAVSPGVFTPDPSGTSPRAGAVVSQLIIPLTARPVEPAPAPPLAGFVTPRPAPPGRAGLAVAPPLAIDTGAPMTLPMPPAPVEPDLAVIHEAEPVPAPSGFLHDLPALSVRAPGLARAEGPISPAQPLRTLIEPVAPVLDDEYARAARTVAFGIPEADDEATPEAAPAQESEEPPAVAEAPALLSTDTDLRALVTAPRPADLHYSRSRRRRFWFLAAAICLIIGCAAGAVAWLALRKEPRALQFAFAPPENTTYPGSPAISPDGQYLVFSAVGPEGKRLLWLRQVNAAHARVLAGTEGGFAPFWSPDSRSIAFFAAKELRKIAVAGGGPQAICPASDAPGGGTWNRDGVILFAPGLSGVLYRVPASGGNPQQVTRLNEPRHDRAHLWPQFLPDGRHFLVCVLTEFEETSGPHTGALDSITTRPLLTAHTNALYSGTERKGHLLFIRNRTLYAQKFDVESLMPAGESTAVVEDVGAVRSIALAPVSVSDTGSLIYQTIGKPTRQLAWFDRTGRLLSVVGDSGEYGWPRIAPSGKAAIVSKRASQAGAGSLWTIKPDNSLAPAAASVQGESPVWSPDGARIAYSGQQEGSYSLFESEPDGARQNLLVSGPSPRYPSDWSPDGRFLLFGSIGAGGQSELWIVHVRSKRAAPLVQTVYGEGHGAFSPDGRWIAYQSEESGKPEIYVQPYHNGATDSDRRYQVSDGGGLPRWRRDGKELFYITPAGQLMAVPVKPSPAVFAFDPPQPLFQTHPLPKTWNSYDVTPDGQRFLVNTPQEWPAASPIIAITNWEDKLRR